jgi:hypothetical protein
MPALFIEFAIVAMAGLSILPDLKMPGRNLVLRALNVATSKAKIGK